MSALSCRRTYSPDLCMKLSLLLLTTLSMSIGVVWGQTPDSQIASQQARIVKDLESIRIAERDHLPEAQRGALWANVAIEYWNATEFEKAEDAYYRSLHLLKTAPSAGGVYASTLDDLASLYLSYGRMDDAQRASKLAFAVRRKLGNEAGIAVGQVHLANIALVQHQFKKAERLALRGVQVMESSNNPPKIGLLSGFITLTYARCSRGDCGDGLKNAQEAVAFANGNFDSDSAPIGFALETLGFAEWKTGARQDGEKAMLEGIRVLRKRLAPGDPRLAGAMLQYRAYLVEANRRVEAQEVQEQVARMISQPEIYCSGCAVSVNSLLNSLR
jgi:tetratricopeptide (TPR) repeat protein